MKMFCTAESIFDGMSRIFTDEPDPEFQQKWMDGDDLVFEFSDDHSDPRPASEFLVLFADRMSREMYLKLANEEKLMNLSFSKGEVGFDQRHAAIKRVLDAAPWTLDQDLGCIQKLSAAPIP